MDIQPGTYASYQKVIDESGNKVLRQIGSKSYSGGGDSYDDTQIKSDIKALQASDASQNNEITVLKKAIHVAHFSGTVDELTEDIVDHIEDYGFISCKSRYSSQG